ncbi:MAG: hypothetical protein JSW00_09770 [Thermoplasmata archaeon]|nr:MAG: hypothetical protein JSW00_09770 [Thermoplasmata archaeon]
MENKTQMGLLLIIIGMLLAIFSTLGSIAASSLGGSGLSPGALIPGILGFFAFILMLAGWILMITGRREFGDKHSQFVVYSIIALIIGFFIVIVGSMISAFAGISSGVENGEAEVTFDYIAMAKAMKTGMIISFVGSLLITIGSILLVYNLENDIGKKVLYIAFIVSIVVSIAVIIYTLPLLDDLAEKLEGTPEDDREDEFYEGIGDISLIEGLGVIGSVILLIGYFIPYNRIKKGELEPVPPPTDTQGMPPYPSYPYQPYPPYQPSPGQPPGAPVEGEPKPDGEVTQPEPTPDGAVQPKAVTPEPIETKYCRFCGTQIPMESTVCPVCNKTLT